MKLVGHANARQKIQLHRKLKEELTDMQRRCKVQTGRQTDSGVCGLGLKSKTSPRFQSRS